MAAVEKIPRPIQAVWMLVEAALFGGLLVAVIYVFRLGWFIPVVLALGAIAAAVLIHVRWKNPFRAAGMNVVLVYVLFLGVFGGAQAGIWKGFIGIEKNATFEMTWSYAEPSSEWPGSTHIVLTFAKYPDHRVGFYSNDLGAYLVSLPRPEVAVEFQTTWDFGKLRGYRTMKIGELTNWHSVSEYGEAGGDQGPSPWDGM